MSDEGLIATMTFSGSLNTASFLFFVEQVLLPQLWVGAIVGLDNLPVHYAQAAIDLIESVVAKVKFYLLIHLTYLQLSCVGQN